MKTPFTRRAEAFADALEHAGTPAAMLGAAELAPLVFLAERLVAVPQAAMPAMGSAVRAQLMAQANASPPPGSLAPATAAPAPAALPSSGPAPAVPALSGPGPATFASLGGAAGQLAAGALALAVAVTGAGVAAQRSVPGEPFHGLKRLVERLELGAAGSGSAEVQALLGAARARLEELRRLAADGALAGEVERVVADLSIVLHRLLDLLAPGVVTTALVDDITALWNDLAELVDDLPAAVQADVLLLLAEVNNRLGHLVAGASPIAGVPHVPAGPTPDDAVPTAAPTAVPTAAPTTLPTPAMTPTTVPSSLPTPVPTAIPTGIPTAAPTAVPTPAPTELPPASTPSPSPSLLFGLPIEPGPVFDSWSDRFDRLQNF